MASSSSSSSRTWRYNVFTSFHGPDARKSFLSHLRKQFNYNGITMFNDQEIERGETISPALIEGIRESRISIVVLTKNYASSGWCLDELLEIMKCKEAMGQIVMTVFYGVDPSDVRKQTGEFGIAFNETCARRTEEEMRRWSQVLNDVGNIAGEHYLNWPNESDMIDKIARDVSNKLNTTISRDFEDMVGIEEHLQKMQALLCLDSDDGAMIVGICGPAGIGKTTIARALHSLLSSSFEHSYFVENLRGSYNSGLDEYGLKLRLQEKLLSNILNQNAMRIYHLGSIQERLRNQKVLIILDDVNDLKQLEALANKTSWFGPGSRIIVTTEDQQLLEQHGINNTYHVGFPSEEEALQIFCTYAFLQSSPPDVFKKLTERVTKFFDSLPLGLRVVGSSLRGKEENEWETLLGRLETSLDRDIEGALRVGYDSLHEQEQALFLHIAVFFNNKEEDHVTAMLADNNLDVKHGLKILANKSLIHKSTSGKIVMHKLLQQMGRQAIHRQEPWRRQILIDAHDICDVLENDTSTRAAVGISFDISGINNLSISERAFKRMRNLRFLSVYKTGYVGNDRVDIAEDMEFPPQLRLLRWEAYPRNALPPTFHPEYLVELDLQDSQLEKLWQGTQPLTNLKKIDLQRSYQLKELPDLSNARNLERLELGNCESLEEIPSYFSDLKKLEVFVIYNCKKLEAVPTLINLGSINFFNMCGCSQLRSFPGISTHIKTLIIDDTVLEELPASIMHCTRLKTLLIRGSGNFKRLTHVPESLEYLDLRCTGIEKIPDCNNGLAGLKELFLDGCRKLKSLPEIPLSLVRLSVCDCESLESVSCAFHPKSYARFNFTNCFKLNKQTRRDIIQHITEDSWNTGLRLLPGRHVPGEFNHQASGNFLSICLEGQSPFTAFIGFKSCIVISPIQWTKGRRTVNLSCRFIGESGDSIDEAYHTFSLPEQSPGLQSEHLCLFHTGLANRNGSFVEGNDISFEFSCSSDVDEIIKCGVRLYGHYDTIWWDKVEEEDDIVPFKGHYTHEDACHLISDNVSEEDNVQVNKQTSDLKPDKGSEEENVKVNKRTRFWSWLRRK